MAKDISRIDQEIDGVHRELRRLESIDRLSAQSWQRAWDKHPELHARERDLYRQRGVAQQERDEKVVRLPKPKPARKCPTCGQKVAQL